MCSRYTKLILSLLIIQCFIINTLYSEKTVSNNIFSSVLKYEKSKNILYLYKGNNIISKLKSENVQFINAIMSTKLTKGTVLIDGHTNPSLGFIFLYNLKTKIWKSYAGCKFAFNHHNNQLAHIISPPHFGSPDNIESSLHINGKFIANIPTNKISSLSWVKNQLIFSNGYKYRIQSKHITMP
jgi:hypothetical protein